MNNFNPSDYKTFYFEEIFFDKETFIVTFTFSLDKELKFKEKIQFPKIISLSNEKLDKFTLILSYLHIILGISYYKSACPKNIVINNNILNKESANFFNKIYNLGLGEFSFNNKLNLNLKFPFTNTISSNNYKTANSNSLLLPIGGGKDSLVAYEVAKKLNKKINFFYVGNSPLVNNLVKKLGNDFINVKREICPNLISLNQMGALNGHIPITAINSFIAITTAFLYDIDSIYFSNERSANTGNTTYNDIEVNHQYSKSLEFENDLRELVKNILKLEINYLSILRPVSEVLIFKKFSKLKKYFSDFSSCNTNFKLTNKTKKLWCNKCPKCAFVFIMLANYLNFKEIEDIFGENLLEKTELTYLFEELLGFKNFKPFECVGEVEEVQYSLFNLAKNNLWKNTKLIKFLSKNYLHKINPDKFKTLKLETLIDSHNLPENIIRLLKKEFEIDE